MNFPAPPLDQIPLGPGEFLMVDGFEIPSLAALVRAHRDRLRAAASYVDGFGGFGELERELGGQGVVLASISVNDNPANFGDDEQLALTNVSFHDVWLPHRSISIAGKPGGYTSVSNMDQLRAAANSDGRDIWTWAAHYGWRGGGAAAAHLCGPHSCGLCSFTVDAAQCYDVGPGGENVDISVCRPGFLGVGTAPPKQEDIMAITAAELDGVPHVFVEAKDGSVWYTYKPAGQGWEGGIPQKQLAGLRPFAPAPK